MPAGGNLRSNAVRSNEVLREWGGEAVDAAVSRGEGAASPGHSEGGGGVGGVDEIRRRLA